MRRTERQTGRRRKWKEGPGASVGESEGEVRFGYRAFWERLGLLVLISYLVK